MRDRFRQRHHGVFHRAVGAAAPGRADLEARDRGGVDDMPFAAVLADQRQEDLQPVHHAHEVHADIPVPLLRRELGDRAAMNRDTGIVAGDVQRAEFLHGGRRRPLHRGAIRHVGHHRDRPRAEPAHLGERRIEPVLADVAQHHGHALARETPRHPEPDAMRGAGHDRGLAFQLLHHVPHRAAAHGWPRTICPASWTGAALWSTFRAETNNLCATECCEGCSGSRARRTWGRESYSS
jgi:hypothetical protein